MHIKKHLIPKENVLVRTGDFYFTNKRLLRYRKQFHGEEIGGIALIE